jgi:hypothetical protein
MLKRLLLNIVPDLLVLAAPVVVIIALTSHETGAIAAVAVAGAALWATAFITGAWSLRREEARGVAMIAAERAKGPGGPPPELLDALGQLGAMVGIDVEDLIATGGVPSAPPQPRYPAPWEPTSEAAPHVFRGTPSSPDAHREGRLLSGRQGPLPPSVNPAPEIHPE